MPPDTHRFGPNLDVIDDRTRRLEADQSKIWDALEAVKDVRIGIGRIEEQLTDGNSKFDRFERLLESHATRLSAVEQGHAVVMATCRATHPGSADSPSSKVTPLNVTIGATGSAGVGVALWELIKAWVSSGTAHH